MRLSALGSLILLAGCSSATPPHAAAVAAAPAAPVPSPAAAPPAIGGPCLANEVTLHFAGRDGQYTGMSHDGALLVLQNTGSRECTVPKRPTLTFADTSGKPVALQINIPPGMHPGPVLVPVKLAPGAMAQGKMQWVMGPVYDNSVCVDVAKASLTLSGGTVSAPLGAHVCTQAGTTPKYEQEWLQPGDGDASK